MPNEKPLRIKGTLTEVLKVAVRQTPPPKKNAAIKKRAKAKK